jgi:hypothetical protein
VQGDVEAREALYKLVLAELRRRAHAYLRQHGGGIHQLRTTILVDDAFLTLVGAGAIAWERRAQFYGCAARAMRDILVDDAPVARRSAVAAG